MAEESVENKPWLWRPPEGGYIGRRGLRPKEAPEKVTGRAVYTNDIYLPGMLYVKVYRSPYAHARIKSMDSSKAEALPGVWAVIRYDDPDIDFSDPYKPALGHVLVLVERLHSPGHSRLLRGKGGSYGDCRKRGDMRPGAEIDRRRHRVGATAFHSGPGGGGPTGCSSDAPGTKS